MDTKKCSKCKKKLPATNKYFTYEKFRKDGSRPFSNICRDCTRVRRREYNKKKGIYKGVVKEREDLKKEGKKKCRICGNIHPNTRTYFVVIAKDTLGVCKDCDNRRNREKVKIKAKENPDNHIIIVNRELALKGLKRCAKCKQNLPIKEYFTMRQGDRKYEAAGYCKKCSNEEHNKFSKEQSRKLSNLYIRGILSSKGIESTPEAIEIQRLIIQIKRKSLLSFRGKNYNTIKEVYDEYKNLIPLSYAGVLKRLSDGSGIEDLFLSRKEYIRRNGNNYHYKVTCIQTNKVKTYRTFEEIANDTKISKSHLGKCYKNNEPTKLYNTSKTNKIYKIEKLWNQN